MNFKLKCDLAYDRYIGAWVLYAGSPFTCWSWISICTSLMMSCCTSQAPCFVGCEVPSNIIFSYNGLTPSSIVGQFHKGPIRFCPSPSFTLPGMVLSSTWPPCARESKKRRPKSFLWCEEGDHYLHLIFRVGLKA